MAADIKKTFRRRSVTEIIAVTVFSLVVLVGGRPSKGAGYALSEKMPAGLHENLLLHYCFDKDGVTKAVDISGMDFHGKVHGAQYTKNGVAGGAMYFDGSDDYISVRDFGLNEFSFSAWVKTSKTGGSVNNRRIFTLDDGGNCYALQGCSRGGVSVYVVNDGVVDEFSDYDWSFDKDELTQITVTHAGGIFKLYKDGRLTETGHMDSQRVTGTLYIGGTDIHRGGFWHGMIDEVMIFNRALSGKEVEQLYLVVEEIRQPYWTGSNNSESVESKHSRWVDILELIDVERDTRGGEWRLEEGVLIGFAQSTLETPYELPCEYDILWEFESNSTAINLLLASPLGKRFEWMMKGWSHRLCGIREVDCRPANANKTTTVFPLRSGVRYVLEVKVRRDRFVATIDEEEIINYKTDWSNIEVCRPWHPFELKARTLGIWLNKHWTKTYRLQVKPYGGECATTAKT